MTGASAQISKVIEDLDHLKEAKENWCTKYDRNDYRYPRSIELEVIQRQGGLFSPYDMTCFQSRSQSDVEHIVALAEAHRSGMCSRSKSEKSRFASDLLNLTLATPALNRDQKIAKDASQWLPSANTCWFAARIVAVKKNYRLTVDKAEKRALKRTLSSCQSLNMRIPTCR